MIYLNGAFRPRQEGFVDIEDRGFQFADGLYEVILVRQGRPSFLSEHLERLRRNASLIKLDLPTDFERWSEVTQDLIVKNALQSGIVYLQITRGVAPREHWSAREKTPTSVIYVKAMEDNREALQNGIKVKSVLDERWGWCNIKSIGLLPNVLAKEEAYRAGAKEAVFHRQGRVTEGASSNVFMIKNGKVLTAPADNLILDGITRRQVLSICQGNGVPYAERPFTLEELRTAEEAFITSTTNHVTPVVHLDGQPIGNGQPGEITRQLQGSYLALIDG